MGIEPPVYQDAAAQRSRYVQATAPRLLAGVHGHGSGLRHSGGWTRSRISHAGSTGPRAGCRCRPARRPGRANAGCKASDAANTPSPNRVLLPAAASLTSTRHFGVRSARQRPVRLSRCRHKAGQNDPVGYSVLLAPPKYRSVPKSRNETRILGSVDLLSRGVWSLIWVSGIFLGIHCVLVTAIQVSVRTEIRKREGLEV
jgi:hypothetical protein